MGAVKSGDTTPRGSGTEKDEEGWQGQLPPYYLQKAVTVDEMRTVIMKVLASPEERKELEGFLKEEFSAELVSVTMPMPPHETSRMKGKTSHPMQTSKSHDMISLPRPPPISCTLCSRFRYGFSTRRGTLATSSRKTGCSRRG